MASYRMPTVAVLRTAIRFARPTILSIEMAACLLVIVTYAKRNRMIYE
jgi:hypothetical protein